MVSSSPRVIRPVGSESLASSGEPVELNLEDLQRLGERMVREARERVAELDARAQELERVLALRQAAAERELLEKKEAAERELAEWKEKSLGEARSAYDAGFERGRADGEPAGRAQGREEGFRTGFEEGYAEGRQAGFSEAQEAERARMAAETAPAVASLASILGELEARRRSLEAEARRDLVPLAIEIAKKIVKREVRECPEIALHNVRKAIDLAFRRSSLVVEVHPEDARSIERYIPDLKRSFAGLTEVAVRPSEDVSRGGCRVVSGSGAVDLRIEAQLEVIEQALFGDLRGEASALDAAECAARSVEEAVR